MNYKLLIILFWASTILLLSCNSSAPKAENKEKVEVKNDNATQIVEASCGQCQFKLPGQGCDLAVRIAGKAYYVTGTKIDDHGDAHANDGFCNAIRKAEVKGRIAENKFQAEYFKLLPKDSE